MSISEEDREAVRRAVHKADDRLGRAFALLDVMRAVADNPDMPELEVQAEFMKWADAHAEACVETAIDALAAHVAAAKTEAEMALTSQIQQAIAADGRADAAMDMLNDCRIERDGLRRHVESQNANLRAECCVICSAPTDPEDQGLCDRHKYDDQPRPKQRHEETKMTTKAEDAIAKFRTLHYPVEVEPSETICGECSHQMPNGRYLPTVEWPCPTLELFGGES